jgi:hypothetical protein
MPNIPGFPYIPGGLWAPMQKSHIYFPSSSSEYDPELNEKGDLVFKYLDTTLTSCVDGTIIINGDAREAAVSILNYFLALKRKYENETTDHTEIKTIKLNKIRLLCDGK